MATDAKLDYWEECISCSCDEHGITLPLKYIKLIAKDIEVAHENIGLAFHVPENPLAAENRRLERALDIEKRKEVCKECWGRGSITTQDWGGSGRCATSQCYKCRGEGKI